MERKKSYYDILGVDFGASDKEIKNKYRELSKKSHPDHSKNRKEEEKAHDIQIELNAAKDTLLNPEKRREYDEMLKPTLKFEEELERGEDLINEAEIQKNLNELLQRLYNFQNFEYDSAKAAYFAQDHQYRMAPVRESSSSTGTYIPRRKRKW